MAVIVVTIIEAGIANSNSKIVMDATEMRMIILTDAMIMTGVARSDLVIMITEAVVALWNMRIRAEMMSITETTATQTITNQIVAVVVAMEAEAAAEEENIDVVVVKEPHRISWITQIMLRAKFRKSKRC